MHAGMSSSMFRMLQYAMCDVVITILLNPVNWVFYIWVYYSCTCSKNPGTGFRNNTNSQLALKCPEDKMVTHLVRHVACWRYDGLKMVARTYSLPPWCTTMVASASTSAAKAMTLRNILFVALCIAPASLSNEIYNAKICRHAYRLVLDHLCNWVDLLWPKAAPSSNKL